MQYYCCCWFMRISGLSSRLGPMVGGRASGAHATLIKWTGWTLTMTMPWWQHYKHCRQHYYYYSLCVVSCSAAAADDDDDGAVIDRRLLQHAHSSMVSMDALFVVHIIHAECPCRGWVHARRPIPVRITTTTTTRTATVEVSHSQQRPITALWP